MRRAAIIFGSFAVSAATFCVSKSAVIAQTSPIIIQIPRSTFFPKSITQPSQKEPEPNPQKKLSDTANDLKTGGDPKTNDGKVNFGKEIPDGVKFTTEPNKDPERKLTAFERPLFRLFGFETANTLKQSELIFQISATSFNNPFDFRLIEVPGSNQNRSNDTNIGFTYGITDNIQVSLFSTGKDDTAFANLVRPNSTLQFFYGSITSQVKWKFYDNETLKAALVVGAEFASPVPTLFSRGGHTITFATPGPRTFSDGGSIGGNELRATDSSIYFSVGFPIAYQATNQLSFHLNPQISFFPGSISASTTAGSTSALIANNIGFDGDRLNYYGTVVGLGFGLNYAITPRLQFAADVTPILAGRNSAGVGDNSLFVQRVVWNAGLQFAPNNRTALSIFATNRFGSNAAASNLLVQPNGDIGYGFQFSYLPDLAGLYKIEAREKYSPPSTYLTYLNGLPSTTLPIYSTLYQLAFGTNGRISPTVRFGLLDDLELAINLSSNSVEELPIEVSALARLALLQDDGQNYSYSSTLGFGFTNLYRRNENLQSAVTLYFDIPTSYRVNSQLTLNLTPKFIVPAQFAGISSILGLSLGGSYNIADSTQILAQYTPIFLGSNQIQPNRAFGDGVISGRTGIYSFGVRQLFPAGDSLYALDLYFTNSSSDYGLQGISALPQGGTQIGLRFNILNGLPKSLIAK